MFKKNNDPGDKTPKQTTKDHISKTAETDQSTQKAQKTAATAPANEGKKS